MEDSGGFTDFPKEAVEVVGPAWKVVGPALYILRNIEKKYF